MSLAAPDAPQQTPVLANAPPAIGWLRRLLLSDLGSSLVAIALALVIGAGLIAIKGANPWRAYAALLDGALGNSNSVAETLVKAIPLAMAGIGISIAFRAGAFNVGAEGQLYLGAIAATWVGLTWPNLPAPVLLALMIAASLAAGGAWAAVAAGLKVWLNASEIINTIMMNYIAIFFIGYLVHGPLQEPGSPLGQTAPLPPAGQLPVLLHATRLHAGLILVIVLAVVAYILLWHSTWGFRIRAVGINPAASQNAGINTRWAVVSAFVLSGAVAGLAGFSEAAGVQHRMIENISPGYGYTAIVVALLGQTNPPWVVAAAVLFAALQVGASTMESAVGVPSSVVTIIENLVVLFIIGRSAFARLHGYFNRPRSVG